jgi:penicillin-binding protein 1A
MSTDWQEELAARLRHWARISEPYAPWFARAMVALSVPLALLYLLPQVLGLFAPRLDPALDLYAVNRPIAFTFLDAAGNDVGHRGAVVGERLKLEQMPAYLPAAFVAMEDRRFYSHNGIDPVGLTRALLRDLRARRWVAGGSTISQQTAKIVYTQQERTVSRKLTELVDAAGLEQSLSKKQILELYLNRLYLGSGAYGVDGAAKVYFGVSAREVTLAQAAMLATLTRAPSVFSPRRDLLAAQQRATWVLDAMVETGAITESQAAQARAHPAIVIDRTKLDARNYFLDTAADEAKGLAGPKATGDLIVHTTLEPALQEAARLAAARAIARSGKRLKVSEAAVVMMHPDGAVAALIGGTDYTNSVFNRATQARRQPGSAFKPFVYLAALEDGISPWDTRDDLPVDINGYRPANFGNNEYGTLTLADAMAHSVNTITVALAQEVGIAKVVAAAKRLGIASPLANNASLALGTSEVTPIELTSAYASFANGGFAVAPYFVTQVDGSGGTVTYYRRQAPAPRRVIDAVVNRDMLAMFWQVVVYGTGASARLPGREAGGKTGTTQDSHDAWFVGFTTDYVTGVWVGNDDSSPTRGVTGGTLPAAIWKEAMLAAEKNLPPKGLDRSPPQEAREPFLLTASDPQFSFHDDESMAGIKGSMPGFRLPQDETAEDRPADGPQTQAPRRRRGGILGFLFGDDSETEEASPPPPPGRTTPPPYPQ